MAATLGDPSHQVTRISGGQERGGYAIMTCGAVTQVLVPPGSGLDG
ncbi:hypothetical protein [Planosporangium mesophilum]|nr:hypothetical protein [Planosporangium mesophilum]NJC86269.1 hypothetical protein [Planosporangium mesophilum]